MPPNNGPVTKADLAAAEQRIKEFLGNELRHRDNDIADFKGWRKEFMAEAGPWRSIDRRVMDLEHFAEDIKRPIDRLLKLFYSVLAVVLTSIILGIIAMWPKLAALLQGGP